MPGLIELDSAEAHHVRDVLRLKKGDRAEAFDDAGNVSDAVIEACDPGHVTLHIDHIRAQTSGPKIVIASAVPKGDRADWMIEKLSELGVSRFIPLMTERSVVHPKGSGKRERWMRIATEAAKQSRRAGVMEIEELASIQQAIEGQKAEGRGRKKEGSDPASLIAPIYLSTNPDARPLIPFLSALCPLLSDLLFFIGPEGGWTDNESRLFESFHLTPIKLTATILRVETAAVAAAAIAATLVDSTQTQS